MNSRSTRVVIRIIATLSLMIPITLIAQVQRDIAPLKPWPAPLYWQPTFAESQAAAKQDTVEGLSTDTTLAATPVGSLVFVAVTPCRIADTRDATFPAGFGPPSLGANTTRTMQLQPIHFEYKPDNALSLPSDGDHVGFSAQEVQKVILEA